MLKADPAMLNELTALKIQAGLLALAHDQLTGDAPPPGEVTLALMAEYCDVSVTVIKYVQRLAMVKVLRGLIQAEALPDQYEGRRPVFLDSAPPRETAPEAPASRFWDQVPPETHGRAHGALQRVCNGYPGLRHNPSRAEALEPHGIDA